MSANREEVFQFLEELFGDVLRESGVTNMFGAPTYVQEEFEITKKESIELWKEWIETFTEKGEQNEFHYRCIR